MFVADVLALQELAVTTVETFGPWCKNLAGASILPCMLFYERGCQEKVFRLGPAAEGICCLGIQPLTKFEPLLRWAWNRYWI